MPRVTQIFGLRSHKKVVHHKNHIQGGALHRVPVHHKNEEMGSNLKSLTDSLQHINLSKSHSRPKKKYIAM